MAEEVFEAYKNKTIEYDEMFPEPIEGFVFPDRMPALDFQENEQGYISANFIDESNTYMMIFVVQDHTDDEENPEESPYVHWVFFNYK